MTGKPDEGWKLLSGKEAAENVPFWKALAQFTADDLNEGLKENAATINREKPIFQKYYNLAFVVSLVLGITFLVFLIGLLAFIRSNFAESLFYITLALLLAAIAPHIWRHAYQYGVKTPDTPLDLPHAPDQHFEEFLSYLQKADGPEAYYLSRFRKKRTPVNRRQFFGKLRYFLFSEHGTDRAMVMRFPAILPIPIPTDLYLHRDDVQRIIAISKPKRKGGPGRNPKYSYADAIVSLIGDPRLDSLDLSDRAKSVRIIKDWLSGWFEAAADASGDVPRGDQLAPYAEKIFDRLRIVES